MTELDGNPGSSITNCAERVHEALIAGGYVPENATIVEHHERQPGGRAEYLVTTIVDNEAQWTNISQREFARIAGFPDIGKEKPFEQVPELLREFGRLRTEINPHWDLPYAEDPEVIARRQKILENAISRATVLAAIQRGEGERALQELLQSDLSLLGEIYGHPRDEYIVFKEFPVMKGYVDFAVFTGRSRMDVFLIEVKGSNFWLVNRRGYNNISAKANEAAQQVRDRMGKAAVQYDDFRQFVHSVRDRVQGGETLYGSLVGPEGLFEVDPDKHIWIRGVVIAGRTADDRKESYVRHNFESRTHDIKLESWDTWARKLTRG